MRLTLDHLVVVAPDLVSGVAHVREALGVEIPKGGTHRGMGTHNHLMRLGETAYLEAIAIDPAAVAPRWPRWYALDRLADRAPFLATFVLRADDMDSVLPRLPRSVGQPIEASRGDLSWRICVPDDGSMPFDGAFPTIIEWPPGVCPWTRMKNCGCSLRRLVVRHPLAATIETILADLLIDEPIRFEPASDFGLGAEIETPEGMRILG